MSDIKKKNNKPKVHITQKVKKEFDKINTVDNAIKITTDAGGRPRNVISMDEIKKLCAIQCTGEEAASFFDVDYDTLNRFCRKETGEGFAECFKKFSGDGKASLRRMQYKLALAGNPTMLIWLGKQALGQSDKIDNDVKMHDSDCTINIVKKAAEPPE